MLFEHDVSPKDRGEVSMGGALIVLALIALGALALGYGATDRLLNEPAPMPPPGR